MRRAYHDLPEIHQDGLDPLLGRLAAAAAAHHRRQAAAWERRRLRLRREKILQLLGPALTGPVRDEQRPLASELDVADAALDQLDVASA